MPVSIPRPIYEHEILRDTPDLRLKRDAARTPLNDFLADNPDFNTLEAEELTKLDAHCINTRKYDSLLANEKRDLFLIDNPGTDIDIPDSKRSFSSYKTELKHDQYKTLVEIATAAEARIYK